MFVLVVLSIGLKRVFAIQFSTDPVTQLPIFEISLWIGDALLPAVLVILFISGLTYAFIEEPARRYGRRLLTSSM